MLLEKRIYCIEGHWDHGKREVEPTVEPILQMLHRLGQWPYARRDCATVEEMKYWIDHEWNTRCREGSVLYFATHGEKGEIWLSNDYSVNVAEIEGDFTNCWVHFSGCEVLCQEDAVREFMAKPKGAAVVSGYTVEAGWTDITLPPAVALEMMLFSSVVARSVSLGDGRSRRKLEGIKIDLNERFPECGFLLHTKKSMGL